MLSNAINNPGQQVDCQLVVQSVGATEYTSKGKPFWQTVLRDPTENNADYNVKIYQGQGEPLPDSCLNQTLPFRIKARVSEFNNETYLSGFWQQPRGQQAPQAPQAIGQTRAPVGGVGQPRGNKDKLIVAQVVYKELSAKFGDPNEFDVWLMKNLPVAIRHTNLLMEIAEGKINPTPPADRDAPELDHILNKGRTFEEGNPLQR